MATKIKKSVSKKNVTKKSVTQSKDVQKVSHAKEPVVKITNAEIIDAKAWIKKFTTALDKGKKVKGFNRETYYKFLKTLEPKADKITLINCEMTVDGVKSGFTQILKDGRKKLIIDRRWDEYTAKQCAAIIAERNRVMKELIPTTKKSETKKDKPEAKKVAKKNAKPEGKKVAKKVAKKIAKKVNKKVK